MKECFFMVLEGILGWLFRDVNTGEHMYQVNDHDSGMVLGALASDEMRSKEKRRRRKRAAGVFWGWVLEM